MSVGAIMNAMFDLWAKLLNKPLWKLLVDLDPDKIVQCIDWRYLNDALTPEEAKSILKANKAAVQDREAKLLAQGPRAYSTAGWLGLTDEEIKRVIECLMKQGFSTFKVCFPFSSLL